MGVGTQEDADDDLKCRSDDFDESDDDDELDEWIRQTGETLYHPVGTCKMGRDEMAVVDAQGRVHGLLGLRVVDASLMPTLIAGNTNAPTIMMAEKISDAILGRRALVPEAQLS